MRLTQLRPYFVSLLLAAAGWLTPQRAQAGLADAAVQLDLAPALPATVVQAPRFIFNLAPLNLVVHTVNLELREAISPCWALVVRAHYNWGSDQAAYPYQGIGTQVGAAFYPGGASLQGFYLEPFLGSFHGFSRAPQGYRNVKLGSLFGHTWISGDHVALSAAVGMQGVLEGPAPINARIVPVGQLSVGYVY